MMSACQGAGRAGSVYHPKRLVVLLLRQTLPCGHELRMARQRQQNMLQPARGARHGQCQCARAPPVLV